MGTWMSLPRVPPAWGVGGKLRFETSEQGYSCSERRAGGWAGGLTLPRVLGSTAQDRIRGQRGEREQEEGK